jgi:hypothetical protein
MLTGVYPTGLAAWSENCKWYSSLPLGAVVLLFVSQSSEFCRHNLLEGTEMSNSKGNRIFRYRLSPETFDTPLYMSVCLSVCLSIHLPTYLPTYFSFFLPTYLHLIYLPTYLSIQLPTYLPTHPPSPTLSTEPSALSMYSLIYLTILT